MSLAKWINNSDDLESRLNISHLILPFKKSFGSKNCINFLSLLTSFCKQ